MIFVLQICGLIVILSAIVTFITLSFAVYFQHRERTFYYVTATYINEIGVRMFLRTHMNTKGDILPVKSIETAIKKEHNAKSVVVIFFKKIPNRMVKYIQEEHGVEILFESKSDQIN